MELFPCLFVFVKQVRIIEVNLHFIMKEQDHNVNQIYKKNVKVIQWLKKMIPLNIEPG